MQQLSNAAVVFGHGLYHTVSHCATRIETCTVATLKQPIRRLYLLPEHGLV